MPDQFVAGIAVKATSRLLLLADYQWVNWSVFDQVDLAFENAATPDQTLVENYGDTNGIRLGFDWTASERLTLRSGYLRHEAAAPDETVTPLLPEGSRNEVTAGIGFQISEKIRADIGYRFIKQNDRRGRVRERLPGESAEDANSGLYEFWAHCVGLTLTLHFGS